jgi:membrane peptidoglycan carboxypeptidase
LIRNIARAVAALVLLYLAYLGWRIAEERAIVSDKVDSIIAGAEPDELAVAPNRVAILLKVEDPTFFTNKGIDLSTPGAGMTTLSQGLGKQIFFENFEPGFRKGELMALTRFALYPMVDKNRTLHAVIANAYFGTHRNRPVMGFADGARTWFRKPLSQLTDREFLELEAMLVAPDRLKPRRGDEERRERAARIERLMAGQCQPTGLRDVMLDGCA